MDLMKTRESYKILGKKTAQTFHTWHIFIINTIAAHVKFCFYCVIKKILSLINYFYLVFEILKPSLLNSHKFTLEYFLISIFF